MCGGKCMLVSDGMCEYVFVHLSICDESGSGYVCAYASVMWNI